MPCNVPPQVVKSCNSKILSKYQFHVIYYIMDFIYSTYYLLVPRYLKEILRYWVFSYLNGLSCTQITKMGRFKNN